MRPARPAPTRAVTRGVRHGRPAFSRRRAARPPPVVRRPRARPRKPRSREAPGPGRATLRSLCEELAGLGQAGADNARNGRVAGSPDLTPVSARLTPADAKPQNELAAAVPVGRRQRVERREAPRSLFPVEEMSAHEQDGCACRRSAPSVASEGNETVPAQAGKTTAYPAPQTIRARPAARAAPPHNTGHREER
jgi:hypothetical protein